MLSSPRGVSGTRVLGPFFCEERNRIAEEKRKKPLVGLDL